MPRSQQPPPGDDDVVDRQVTFALRRLPTEIPVPDHVADRISQALAAEAETQHGAATATPDATPEPSPAAPRWYRRPASVLAVAATAGIVGLAGASVLNSVTGGGSTTTSETAADAGAGRAESAGAAAAPSDDAADSTLESAGGGDRSTLAAQGYTAAALTDRVLDVWRSAVPDSGSCGAALAGEVGGRLVGSAEAGANVLIVVESPDAGALQGWLIPTCSDTTAAAIDHLEVPKPDR
jgi:hypothetical protein